VRKLFATLALLLVAAPARADDVPVAPGSVGIRLLEAPVSGRGDPRALSYIVDTVQPGTTFARDLEVWNGAAERITFSMHAGAAEIRSDEWVADPFAANELTRWVSFRPRRFTVQPRTAQVVTATIRVPRRATAGERYAALFAVTEESTGEGNLKQRSAVGVRVYLVTGGDLPSAFTVSNLRATPDAILADVRNTGERALDVTGRLTLRDGPSGLSAGPFDSPQLTLAVGATGTVRVSVSPDLPRGPWDARLVIRSGRIVYELSGTITLPTTGGHPVKLVEGNFPLLQLSLAGVAAGLLLLIRRRRRKRPVTRLTGFEPMPARTPEVIP